MFGWFESEPFRQGVLLRSGIWLLIFLFSILMNAACTSNRQVPLYEGEFPAPDTTTLTQVSDLRIAPLDELEIKVFGVEELDGVYQVDNEGVLKLPLVGAVTAKGFTSFELAAILEEQLTADFLQESRCRGSRHGLQGPTGNSTGRFECPRTLFIAWADYAHASGGARWRPIGRCKSPAVSLFFEPLKENATPLGLTW